MAVSRGSCSLRSSPRTIGRSVRVLLPAGEPIEGEATEVGADGQLVGD